MKAKYMNDAAAMLLKYIYNQMPKIEDDVSTHFSYYDITVFVK